MSLTYKVVNEVEHTIRRGYRSDVNGQLNLIVDLINKIEEKTGAALYFDNTIPNKYVIEFNGNRYEFNLYRDIIAALNLILEIN